MTSKRHNDISRKPAIEMPAWLMITTDYAPRPRSSKLASGAASEAEQLQVNRKGVVVRVRPKP